MGGEAKVWRLTHKIIDKFMKSAHNKELPEWVDCRIKEQSDLIRQWYNKNPINKVKDWEVAQQWNNSVDPVKDWKFISTRSRHECSL